MSEDSVFSPDKPAPTKEEVRISAEMNMSSAFAVRSFLVHAQLGQPFECQFRGKGSKPQQRMLTCHGRHVLHKNANVLPSVLFHCDIHRYFGIFALKLVEAWIQLQFLLDWQQLIPGMEPTEFVADLREQVLFFVFYSKPKCNLVTLRCHPTNYM